MNKSINPKLIAQLSRYTAEELDPEIARDQAAMDAFIARNRDALNEALEAGYLSLNNGDAMPIHTLEDLLAALEQERRRPPR